MKPTLFHSAASRFAIGDITTVSIHASSKMFIEGQNRAAIESSTQDEYGDSNVVVRIPTTSTGNWPVAEFRLLNADGTTGFSNSDSGNKYARPFTRDAYYLVGNKPYILPISEMKDSPKTPWSFIASENHVPCLLTFHQTDENKLRTFWQSRDNFSNRREPEFWVNSVFDSLELCGFVTLWSLAYGENPTILTRSKMSTLQYIQEQLLDSNSELMEVPEYSLPEW